MTSQIQEGQGWRKNIGAGLITLAGIGTLGSLGEDPVHGIIGGAVLSAVGAALLYKDRQTGRGSMKIVDKYLLAHLKKRLKSGSGLKLSGQGKINKEKIIDFLKEHKNVEIHISHILGSRWKQVNKDLKRLLMQRGAGFNLFKKIGKAGSKLRSFIEGKTKLKPSHLLSYLSGAVGIAGAASALIPGVDLISVPIASATALGLKGLSTVAKTSGRGLPEKYIRFIEQEPAKARIIIQQSKQKGSGLIKKGIYGAIGLALFHYLRKNPHLINEALNLLSGKGLEIAGGGIKIQKKHMAFINKYPKLSEKILNYIKQRGRGSRQRIIEALGIAGTASAASAYAFYQYLLKHPEIAAKMVVKGVALKHGTGNVPSVRYRRRKGKIMGSKSQVWNSNTPHEVTPGGLMKADLMLSRGRVISKRKHEIGVRNKRYII